MLDSGGKPLNGVNKFFVVTCKLTRSFFFFFIGRTLALCTARLKLIAIIKTFSYRHSLERSSKKRHVCRFDFSNVKVSNYSYKIENLVRMLYRKYIADTRERERERQYSGILVNVSQ